MIGSLLYLTHSRHGIVFPVDLCARFETCVIESHQIFVNFFFRYLVGTTDIGQRFYFLSWPKDLFLIL